MGTSLGIAVLAVYPVYIEQRRATVVALADDIADGPDVVDQAMELSTVALAQGIAIAEVALVCHVRTYGPVCKSRFVNRWRIRVTEPDRCER